MSTRKTVVHVVERPACERDMWLVESLERLAYKGEMITNRSTIARLSMERGLPLLAKELGVTLPERPEAA